nr:PREDICTED: integrin beta-nu isoform X1 [Megachile rotundata]XP_012150969.1 PREDICTED: integrin beta-nu isoform X1 [Megachile rotundata]
MLIVKMRLLKAILFVILLCRELGDSQNVEMNILKLCVSQTTCGDCLQANFSCSWCSAWSYSNSTIGRPRCNAPERLKAFGCPSDQIRNNSLGSIDFLENADFQDMSETGQTPLQLKPQRVKVRIQPHSKIEIPIHYRVAKNYPLDLYYLMDLTWSMKDDKETLVSLGQDMSRAFGTITSNFRLGFGSYADKPLMPFIFPGHENNPCQSERTVCAPLYDFQHRLKLTNNIYQFTKEVNESQVTGNVDNLEGALDGIVQAILCKQQVGWEQQARKIILVATDGSAHFAGDGKLGGAVARQDFECHLDEQGQYSMATKYDYCSLAELSRLLQEHKINLIFAVTEDRRSEYESTAALLKEKARVATLTSNSSNILEIIKSAYQQITSRVILSDNSSAPLRMEYFSNCGNRDIAEWSTSECEDIEEGQVYNFNVVLSIDKCPSNESLWKQTIVIEDALASEVSKVVVEVELLCGCNCNDPESPNCEHGTDYCGVCKCDRGWSGEKCDCDERSPTENRLQCMEPNSTKICSDRGECVCGSCLCDQGYNGQFCECSECDKIDGIECSNRGICKCGVCHCIEGWQGDACKCPSTDDACIAPGSNEVCAGHGYCDCGECRCNVTTEDNFYYLGTYCESSISSGGSALCVLYNPCVNATVEDPEMVDEFCQTNVTSYKTELVNVVDKGNERYCFVKNVKDKTICIIPYVYEFQKTHVVALNIGNKECYTPMHAAVIPALIIFLILTIGIICLLIWKCWTSIQDKREYEKFQKEREKTIFSLHQNPLFRSPITEFRVPSMYKED